MSKKYPTPAGHYLTLEEIEADERIICDNCKTAVVEDEYFSCETDECKNGMCTYCWEGLDYVCPACHLLHAVFANPNYPGEAPAPYAEIRDGLRAELRAGGEAG